MTQIIEIKVPDIGDFKDVPVIEILVAPGDKVEKETSLVTLETEKASMEIPSPLAGEVKAIQVKVGDKVSEGSVLLTLLTADETASQKISETKTTVGSTSQQPTTEIPLSPNKILSPTPSTTPITRGDIHADVVVIGAGPGGYTAAFRAADLGKKIVLIERYSTLGGVCLNVGCIPSKALLHAAKVITDAEEAEAHGITFGKANIDLNQLRQWKESVIGKLTKGLKALAKQRKVEVVYGTALFANPHLLEVETSNGKQTVSFENCIIAAGSSVTRIPGFPYDDPRMMDSTDALALKDVPKRMLIIGGGIIGLEMATVYSALGSKISVVEWLDQLIPGADAELVKPLHRRIKKRYEAIYLKTKVTKIVAETHGLTVTFEGDETIAPQTYDRILLAIGRRPNGLTIGADKIGLHVNERGFIPVDTQMRTNLSHIFAIGDIVGEPMLAHKATYEGKIAAEVIAGHKVAFDARTIPSVAYTDPEIAWMGLTEKEAIKQGIAYEKANFLWAASGRAISMAREEGLTQLIFEKDSRRILGAGMVGINAGELIAETVLALEMGADMQDLSLTIHPHPTLSETVLFAAEIAEGTITDLFLQKK
ncbi:MAG TPA: dihydrolipoyl dehydrogenase [Nitrosomonas sp.]|nr:dihydrolipoyl dehydrogenase [Nitrosomonas sp.]HQX14436.1 dihydrolipoyl dehydrogenase [Nitrosomonas sp.]HRB33073.1 dihydrolipoyl dehydrogenase [Nitrosomonas sp.]HRB46560.1 dihydrolipoyl dehydrogenase [Nitrosomonas sp.]HRB78334.1 dihydrolipoyl dehydrogenase [Nitrosomonas sp.]